MYWNIKKEHFTSLLFIYEHSSLYFLVNSFIKRDIYCSSLFLFLTRSCITYALNNPCLSIHLIKVYSETKAYKNQHRENKSFHSLEVIIYTINVLMLSFFYILTKDVKYSLILKEMKIKLLLIYNLENITVKL